MRANEIYDDVRELVFLRQFYPLPDVSDDDFCTFDVAQFVVGRSRRALILGEILRIGDLADVVVQSSCADQQGVSTNEFCGVLSKVSNLHGVLERTWGFFREAFEQWVVRVGEFEECKVRDYAEGTLEEVNEGEDEEQYECSGEGAGQGNEVGGVPLCFSDEVVGKMYEEQHQHDAKGALNELGTFVDASDVEDGGESSGELDREEMDGASEEGCHK